MMNLGSLLGRRMGRRGHVNDADLIALFVTTSDVPTAQDEATLTHVSQCSPCAKRSVVLESFLDRLADTSHAAFEADFPDDRWITQKERIVRRLRRVIEPDRSARVLRFPALARPTLSRVEKTRRWLGASAAAGLLVGLAAGQFFHVHPTLEGVSEDLTASVSSAETSATPQSVATEMSPGVADDLFLDELGRVLSGPQIPELISLDEITPRIREVTVYTW